MEQLIYDTRMMNEAVKDGREGIATYQRWTVRSDAGLDPQAYILTPTNIIRIAKAIVSAKDHYRAGCAAALEAIAVLREGSNSGCLHIIEREKDWLENLEATVGELPESENDFIADQLALADKDKFLAAEYGL
jgi:methanol--5-hydroxybenzimidazolylcobamide Co-methyltransferase